MASRFNTDTTENGVRSRFSGCGQFIIGQRHQALGFLGRCNPYHAGTVARQRDKYTGTLRRMKLGRGALMWARMPDVERQCGLIEFAAPDRDASSRAAA